MAEVRTRAPVKRSRARRVFSLGFGRQFPPEIEHLVKGLESQQIKDPFRDDKGAMAYAGDLALIEPPFSFSALMRLPRENNMLRQCIDAMVTNIDGHGWRLEFVGEDPAQKESKEAENEKRILENLLETPNQDHSLAELRERVRCDVETIGNGYVEMGRDRLDRAVMLAHLPGHTVRMSVKDEEPTEVTVELPREGAARKQKIRKHFRRYVQAIGTRRVYFKEFGDPRNIDPKTGRVNDELAQEETATELIHFTIYSPGTPYGVPRWINQLPAIMGSRQSELTNLDFFKQNAIPAMAVLVAGGSLTQETLEDIEEQLLSGRGRGSMNRVIVFEARGDENAAAEDGKIPAPRIEMKSMQGERQQDALFQEYDDRNMTKIRSSFRLPPIFVGLAEDYTHATAKTSFEVAESQVFGPERTREDEVWNMQILGTYEPKFWAFRSNPPRITDPEDVLNAIERFEQTGAMTPNLSIGMANEFFDLEIPEIEEAWGDLPFAFVKAIVEQGKIPKGVEVLMKGVEDLPANKPPEPPQPPQPPDDDGQPTGDEPGAGDDDNDPAQRGLSSKKRRVRARVVRRSSIKRGKLDAAA